MKNINLLEKLQHFDEIIMIGPMFREEHCLKLTSLPTLFIDGGAKAFNQSPAIFKLKIGDGDSTVEEMDILLAKEKDFTDLHFALSIVPPHIRKIYFYGFQGGRVDHHFVNFGEIYRFLKTRKTKMEVHIDDQIIAHNEQEREMNIQGLFSLMFLEESVLKIQGECQFNVEESQNVIPLSGHTLSNQGHGSVTITSNNPYFLFRGEVTAF